MHEDAAYIYRKQLEESEVILITKTDLLSDEEVEKLVKDTQTCFHHTKVMTASTMNGSAVTARQISVSRQRMRFIRKTIPPFTQMCFHFSTTGREIQAKL